MQDFRRTIHLYPMEKTKNEGKKEQSAFLLDNIGEELQHRMEKLHHFEPYHSTSNPRIEALYFSNWKLKVPKKESVHEMNQKQMKPLFQRLHLQWKKKHIHLDLQLIQQNYLLHVIVRVKEQTILLYVFNREKKKKGNTSNSNILTTTKNSNRNKIRERERKQEKKERRKKERRKERRKDEKNERKNETKLNETKRNEKTNKQSKQRWKWKEI